MKGSAKTKLVILFFKFEILLIPLWMYLLVPSIESVIFSLFLSITLLYAIVNQFTLFEFYITYSSFGILQNELNNKKILKEFHWREIKNIKLKRKRKTKILKRNVFLYEIELTNGKKELLHIKPSYKVLHHEFELYANNYVHKDCFKTYTETRNPLMKKVIQYDEEKGLKYNLKSIENYKKIFFYLQLNVILVLNLVMLIILILSIINN